jgi:hypothetical protein
MLNIESGVIGLGEPCLQDGKISPGIAVALGGFGAKSRVLPPLSAPDFMAWDQWIDLACQSPTKGLRVQMYNALNSKVCGEGVHR